MKPRRRCQDCGTKFLVKDADRFRTADDPPPRYCPRCTRQRREAEQHATETEQRETR